MVLEIEMIGEKFGKLKVVAIGFTVKNGKGQHMAAAKCICECGEEIIASISRLKSKRVSMCHKCVMKGLRESTTVHGSSPKELYSKWKGMKARCYKKTCERYYRYGARGIRVCDEWRNDFSEFRKWAMSSGWKPGLTIDRIDYNGNYEPQNCRWATMEEQARNSSHCHMIKLDGIIVPISVAAERLSMKYGTLKMQIRRRSKKLSERIELI